MRRIYLTTLALLTCFFSIGQVTSDDLKIKSSINGNVYCYGQYKGALLFSAADSIGSYNSGGALFLCKMDSAGTILWHLDLRGGNAHGNVGMCTDNQDNVYLTGNFAANLVINSNTVAVIPGNTIDNAFIAKINSAGIVQWVKTTGGTAIETYGSDVAIDENKNVYATGRYYYGSFTIGNLPAIPYQGSGPSLNFDDIYIAKLDSMGNAVWLQGIHGGFSKYINSIAVSKNGTSYLSGDCFSGSGALVTDGSAFPLNHGSFLVSYNPAGNLSWLTKVPNTGYHNTFEGVVLDKAQYLYGNGQLSWNIDFGNGIASQLTTNTSTYTKDAFVVKYNNSGYDLWARQAAANPGSVNVYGEGKGIAYDSLNNSIVVIGRGGPSVLFPPLSAMASAGEFLVKLDTAGNGLCRMALPQFYTTIDVTTDQFGNAYVIGNAVGGFNNEDITIAKIRNNCTVKWNKSFQTHVYHFPISVAELGLRNLKIYPNPSGGILNVETDNAFDYTIEVNDLNGKLLISENFIKNTTIDLQKFEQGVYTITIRSDSYIETRKFVLIK